MLIVYLSNRYIRAVKGTLTGKKFHIHELYHMTDHRGCILNGTVTDDEVFIEVMRKFWWDNKLPKKKVHLVLDSSQFTTKSTEVPIQKPEKMMEFVTREFSDVDRIKDPVYGYFPLMSEAGKGKKLQEVYAMMAPKDYVQKYLELFHELGISIESIESVMGAMLHLTQSLSGMQKFTGLLQFVDDITILNALMVDGKVVYTGRSRLYSDLGTPQYPVEVARGVSGVMQFARSQGIYEVMKNIYISGLSSEDFSVYSDGIMQIEPQLEPKELILDENLVFGKGLPFVEEDMMVPGMLLTIGGIHKINPETNIVFQACRNIAKEEAAKKRRKIFVPLVGAGAVMGLIIGYLGVTCAYEGDRLRRVEEFNQNPTVLAACDRYDEAMRSMGYYQTLDKWMKRLDIMVREYPLVNSKTEEVVSNCAEGLVKAVISSYDASTGVLTFDTKAEEVELIHQFAALLGKQIIFQNVDYTGYTRGNDNMWNVRAYCTMAGREVPES